VGTALTTLANGAFNLLVAPTVALQGHREATIGVVVAAAGVASLLTRIPAGNAFRPRRVTALVLVGSALASIGYGVLPFVSAAPSLAGSSALQGAGFALATTTGMAALIERRHRDTSAGSLMGWYTGSIGAGYALAGFVAGPLADAVGLEAALVATAAVAGTAGLVSASALRRLPVHRYDEDAGAPPRGWLRRMPAGVWLGAAVALYINVVNGGLNAFFPLYGLAIGLTLSQIGVLTGVHATAASVIRFGAGSLLHRVPVWAAIGVPVFVVASGVTVLGVTREAGLLLGVLAAVGLARGVLRVASGALVMEAAGPSSRDGGRASGIYLAGLDLGNAVGPLLGGAVADAAGVRASFPVLGLAPAAVFLALALVVRGSASRSARRSVRPEAP
jgi:MFS family permease